MDFSIVASNDFHGRVEESASVLACTVDDYRAQNPNTLFASAGDNIGASTFTSFIQQDEPSIEALNAMDLDVSALFAPIQGKAPVRTERLKTGRRLGRNRSTTNPQPQKRQPAPKQATNVRTPRPEPTWEPQARTLLPTTPPPQQPPARETWR